MRPSSAQLMTLPQPTPNAAIRKPSRPPAYRIENEYNPEEMPQYFQISVNVLEAKKLAWANPQTANSYVYVVLGKKKFRTNIRRNMEEPYYREYFVFELYTSVQDVQRSSLWLAVMETRCFATPRLMGEANIDLGAIWAQPHHQVFHKWAQLSLPRDPGSGPVGFLKVDISITFRGEVQIIPTVVNDDKVEDNLLLPSGYEQQRANYQITVYGAFGLPNGVHCHTAKRYGKPPNTFVRVSFCGMVVKTAAQNRSIHPNYNEVISMVEMFPNINSMIRLDVCSADGCFNKVLASTHLHLEKLSHEGENGFLPTFGPSLLHMYGTTCSSSYGASNDDGPFHKGALFVSLRTIVPYYQQGVRSTSVEPTAPIQPGTLWQMENFCVFCPVLEVSMLDRKLIGKLCGVAITIGDIPNAEKIDEEFATLIEEIKTRKLHYTGSLDVIKTKPTYGYLDFPNAFPILQLASTLPDFRFRMHRNNMISGIASDLDSSINEAERRLQTFNYTSPSELVAELNKAVDDAAGSILKFLDIVQYASPGSESNDDIVKFSTELDQRQLELQRDDMGKIYKKMINKGKDYSSMSLLQAKTFKKPQKKSLFETRKGVKLKLAETREIVRSMKNLVYKAFEGWPDIILWLLNSGSRVAYCRISAADIIYSLIPEQCGRTCGRIQTAYLKPIKCPKHMTAISSGCYCVVAKVEFMMWMGLYRQRGAFDSYVPSGYKLKIKSFAMCLKTSTMMLECRAFIYRAKFNVGVENTGLAHAFARVNVLNSLQDTKVKPNTLTPVWNQVLKIHRMVFTTPERLIADPPIILIEVFDNPPGGKCELIGRFQLPPVIDERPSYEFAPKLMWYDIYKGVEYTGQVLMSVQLLMIPEKVLKTTEYSPYEESITTDVVSAPPTGFVEPLPPNLIPQSATYKVDIYWWGLRDVTITKKPCVVFEIDETIIKSEIITEKKTNSNFPNGRTSQLFEAPLNETYSPPLSIRLYDSSTFGRTIFLGTNILKNPNKFVVNWLPKTEREASLNSASIISSQFLQVKKMLFVKTSDQSIFLKNAEQKNKEMYASNAKQENKSSWSGLFWRRNPSEEERTLLPLFAKKKVSKATVTKKPMQFPELKKDWWLRFMCSHRDCFGDEELSESEKIVIFNSELECQPQFSKFKDWCATMKLYNGKKTGIPEKDEQLYCGFLKAGIAIYRWPPPSNTVAVSPSGVDLLNGFFDDHPNNEASKFLVRIYLVKGFNLLAKDINGKSDPYVIINCGKKHLGDRKNYVPNTLNPLFGRMYEMRVTLPEDYLLTVSVYDYDLFPPDQLIGCTAIDLEDRIYTKHRARVGLTPEYKTSGLTKWRDCLKPSAILEELCAKNHIPPPIFPDQQSVLVNGIEYRDNETVGRANTAAERKENLCLNLLHKWHTLPICGYPLVPEHVETRTLFNPDKPGLDQGKIQMWVDIFPLDAGGLIPSPTDITPRKTEEYELRVIVWDVEKVKLDDYDIVSGNHSSDIYVKAVKVGQQLGSVNFGNNIECRWIGTQDNAQRTDIHYRSLTGEGNFNWRMIFNFNYQHAERKLVIEEKGIFTEAEEHVPPILVVQVMDSDTLTADDFLGSLSLHLIGLPRGASSARRCSLKSMEKAKMINLFSIHTIRGWWPLKTLSPKTGMDVPAGVIDLELTLLPKDKAVFMPVGIGRDPPSPLPEPHRPNTSYNIFLQPLQALKNFFFGRGYKALIVGALIAVVVLMFISVILDLPKVLLEKWIRGK